MALKKENVIITPEGLQLVTVLNYSSIEDINGFYGKEVFFTEGFDGELLYLFQALGNLGANARAKDFDKDIDVMIISNNIMNNMYSDLAYNFRMNLEDKLNQNNSPYRRLKFISEEHLINYILRRANSSDDDYSQELIDKYKKSVKTNKQGTLF